MKEYKNKDHRTIHAVDGIFNKIKNKIVGVNGSVHPKKKKIIIITLIIILLAILICAIMFKKNNTQKLQAQKQAETEAELINLEIEVKQETSESYNCLLTFTSNDENDKIKSIEYPIKEGETVPYVLNIAGEEGKDKIAIDYEISRDDKEKNFKVVTKQGNIKNVKTVCTITYYYEEGKEYKKDVLKGERIIAPNSDVTYEGMVLWGWIKNKDIDKPEIYIGDEFNCQKNTTLYPLWLEDNLIEDKKTFYDYRDYAIRKGNTITAIDYECNNLKLKEFNIEVHVGLSGATNKSTVIVYVYGKRNGQLELLKTYSNIRPAHSSDTIICNETVEYNLKNEYNGFCVKIYSGDNQRYAEAIFTTKGYN